MACNLPDISIIKAFLDIFTLRSLAGYCATPLELRSEHCSELVELRS
jgi:hypothetical protein